MTELLRAIAQSIAFIKSRQNPDGGFSSLSSFDPEDFSGATEYRTTFFAANVLSCLNSVSGVLPKTSELEAARENAVWFLFAEKSKRWSWNYWSRGAKEREAMPYPDDLDDTFAALAALHGYDPGIIDGGVLARAAKLLTAVEAAPGGPYRTWLVKPDAPPEWRDVDVVVNSNVVYFLSLFSVMLPGLAKFFDGRIQSGNVRSPYYPGVVPAIYFISRWYRGEQKAALAAMLCREREQCDQRTTRGEKRLWKNLLESAMALSALVNFGLAEKISKDGAAVFARGVVREGREGWRPYAFCIDPSREGKTCYAGSPALTAAFCAEALAQYFSAASISVSSKKSFVKKSFVGAAPDAAAIFERAKAAARKRTLSLPYNLAGIVSREIDAATTEEIVLVPYLAHAALGTRAKPVSEAMLDELALANLYGWLACAIYDDFLDGEGEPLALSAANFFLRELTAIYAGLENGIPGVASWYQKIMDGIDGANVWEQINGRAKIENGALALSRGISYRSRRSLEHLADRSMGHALPALATLVASGCGPDSPDVGAALSFFRRYLAARQLHDDAHDWSEDLLRGHVTSVVARLIRMWLADRGEAERNGEASHRFDIAARLPDLKKLFWRAVIPGVVADIKNLLNRARRDLVAVSAFENIAPLARLLDRLESAADRALRERDQAIDFLAAYRR